MGLSTKNQTLACHGHHDVSRDVQNLGRYKYLGSGSDIGCAGAPLTKCRWYYVSGRKDQPPMNMVNTMQVTIQTAQMTWLVSCGDVKRSAKITMHKHSK